jgi:hypothetical protein
VYGTSAQSIPSDEISPAPQISREEWKQVNHLLVSSRLAKDKMKSLTVSCSSKE